MKTSSTSTTRVVALAVGLITACFTTGCDAFVHAIAAPTDTPWPITDHVMEASREPIPDELGPVEKAYITTDGRLIVCLRGRLAEESAMRRYHMEIMLDDCVEHASRQASSSSHSESGSSGPGMGRGSSRTTDSGGVFRGRSPSRKAQRSVSW